MLAWPTENVFVALVGHLSPSLGDFPQSIALVICPSPFLSQTITLLGKFAVFP